MYELASTMNWFISSYQGTVNNFSAVLDI